MNKKNGHPAFVYKENETHYYFIGLTHAKITQGIKNIKLRQNPNIKDERTSYVRPFSEIHEKTKFRKKKYKNWKNWKSNKKILRKIKKKIKNTTSKLNSHISGSK